MKKEFEIIIDNYVNEIWTVFDSDDNGTLDKEETRSFIRKMLEEVGENPEFSDEEFDKCFKEFDADGSSTISKQEMKDFIMKICGY